MTYEKQCQYGREVAAIEVADCAITGNYPKLIRTIRDMASQSDGVSTGFLHFISENATTQIKQERITVDERY